MDLIYMNSEKIDQGILTEFEMDLAFGKDENNFECTISTDQHCCNAGDYLYIEGTEYGGIIDALEVKTDSDEIVYSGRSWHGILASKVIYPLTSADSSSNGVTLKTAASGQSLVGRYLVISGDANKCINYLINRLDLSGLFIASTEPSNNISSYQFDRFTDGYTGMQKMLNSAGLKLEVRYLNGMVVLSAIEQHDYSTDEEFDSSMVEMNIKKRSNSVNHLVCLGGGELENRTVIDLYADRFGNISEVQTVFGMDEYVAVYDYSAVESEEELLKEGTKHLKELWQPDEMSVDLDSESDSFGIGDKIGAFDNITGLSFSATIKKKIVNIQNAIISISYEVGE